MNETFLDDNAYLVSETDAKGIITFANEEFCKVAGYSKEELIGQSHNIVRHKDMPKAAFEDLWKTVKEGNVWQGYVKNNTKNGGFYWVYATVYPYVNENKDKCYMSCRRKFDKSKLAEIENLYRSMR